MPPPEVWRRHRRRRRSAVIVVFVSLMVAACGGAGDGNSADDRPASTSEADIVDSNAPVVLSPTEFFELAGGIDGRTTSVTASLRAVFRLPFELPTPAGFELESVAAEVDTGTAGAGRISIDGASSAAFDDLVSFYDTKFAALRLGSGERETSGAAAGRSWATIRYEGSRVADAIVTVADGDRQRTVTIDLAIHELGEQPAIRQLVDWAAGFPAVHDLEPGTLTMTIDADRRPSFDLEFAGDAALDIADRLTRLESGLPFDGFRAIEPIGEGPVVELAHDDGQLGGFVSVGEQQIALTLNGVAGGDG